MTSFLDYSSEHLKHALANAVFLAIDQRRSTVEPLHLLWALRTEKGSLACEILKRGKLDPKELLKEVKTRLPKESGELGPLPTLSLRVRRVLEKAALIAAEHQHPYVGTEHVLFGLIALDETEITEILKRASLNRTELLEHLTIVMHSISRFPEMREPSLSGPNEETAQKTPHALEVFGVDWSKPSQKTHDPLIGRETELERVMQILCRKTKNNPLLLGEPGVGKTAIVEGLAERIRAGTVPAGLLGKRLIALDLPHILAGTMYRGEFEARLKQIVDEAKNDPNVILFIDEIHTIVGAGSASGSLDAANMLKPALARGWIRCIGATTFDEYKQHIESDQALERRFQTVAVEEPNAQTAITMLRGLAPAYEQFHRVEIDEEAIEHAVRLSIRHLPTKRLPDKAIDLIDEAAARVKLHEARTPTEETFFTLTQTRKTITESKRQAILDERFDEAERLRQEETVLDERLAALKEGAEAPRQSRVDKEAVLKALAASLGVEPRQLVPQKELESFSETLKTHISGQDHVLAQVSRILKRSRSGLQPAKRPLGSCLFVGPTGVGKTALAKALAEVFFQDKKAFLRLDMSEYSEGFSVSKLVGAPAGYVGYKEGAKLIDHLKRRPHTVILFDEFDRAHHDVQQLLLQMLEEGELTDASGRSVHLNNTLIILTSNIGAERLSVGEIGFRNPSGGAHTLFELGVKTDLKERVKPELLGRIDEICVFYPLSETARKEIAHRELQALKERLRVERGQDLLWENTVLEHLADVSASTPISGREIVQRVRTFVEVPLIDALEEHLSYPLLLNLTEQKTLRISRATSSPLNPVKRVRRVKNQALTLV